ncbi:MAG TPA: hypothetical protein VLH94_02870 [Spirochaetia bacterium]|nr:hypothetical protein [Spirochaetia bacterium]
MKFVIVLLLSVIITVSVGIMVKKIKIETNKTLISPIVSGVSATKTSLSVTPTSTSISNWQVYVNNYYGYKIKHPPDINIKNKRNGDVEFQTSKSINTSIIQKTLTKNTNIHTILEKDIDIRKSELKDKFSIVNTISPIALGSVTAQTFTTKENNHYISYYYIPQNDNKYLLIANSSSENNSTDYLISENIIYSIELLP